MNRLEAARAFLASERVRATAIGDEEMAAAIEAIVGLEPHDERPVDGAPALVEALSGDAKIAADHIVSVVAAQLDSRRRDEAARTRADAARDRQFIEELERTLGGSVAEASRWFPLRRELEVAYGRLAAGDARGAVDLRREVEFGRAVRESVARTLAIGESTVIPVVMRIDKALRDRRAGFDARAALTWLRGASLGERSIATSLGLPSDRAHQTQVDNGLLALKSLTDRADQSVPALDLAHG